MKTKEETFPIENLFYILMLIAPIILLSKVESHIEDIGKWTLLASPVLAINIGCYFVNRNIRKTKKLLSSRFINLLALFFSIWLFYYCLFILNPNVLEPLLSSINSQSFSFLFAIIILFVLSILDYRREEEKKYIYVTSILLSGLFIIAYIIYSDGLFNKF